MHDIHEGGQMKRLLPVSLSSLIAILVIAVAAGAQPQAVDRTTLKFSTPMMVPGTTLPPGTYTFRLAKTTGSRNVVQIWNEDETKLITTVMAIPAKRQDPKGDVAITLQRTAAKAPPALKSWFYPGDLRGHELIYSEKQARVLAEETKTLVLSSDAPEGSDLDSMAKARLWHAGPKGERKEYREEGSKQK
jgi:hypothetical protein